MEIVLVSDMGSRQASSTSSTGMLNFQKRHQKMFRSGGRLIIPVIVVIGSDRIAHLIPNSGRIRITRILLILLRFFHVSDSMLSFHVTIKRLTVSDQHLTDPATENSRQMNVLHMTLHVVAPVAGPAASLANPLATALD